ncbi:cysteine-rich repeat secretory protein 38-like [Zingiber officinale]|uniref:cysteine-rich repeat secretory protein 38-like n=1 Tax=Zingiber officinale TaxID=94328 RepID=UPI001C4AC6A7|nr:cysteine-rich repeat secretory protein 38-like [Zingiber officinale]
MAANPFRADCGGDAYNSSSSFGRSLSGLLSSLTFLSSNSNSANATATAGAGRDSVYGLYMCQGDLFGSNCQSCIQTAVAGANQSCPGVHRAIVYYDQCHLCYSDANFFGVVDADGFNMTNPLEVTSSRMAFNILSDLVQAAPQQRPFMFATNLSDMYPLFALAQCTADLSPDGCRRCLTASLAGIENCCIQRKGWRYLSPSCWIRYEPTPFFGNYPNNLSTYIIRSQCSSLDVQSDDLSARTANLRGLFDDLSAQAPATGFYSSSAGDGDDRMYGLGLCAGDDATRGECAACLATAGQAIANECPNKTEGYMWYGPCFLKYS